MKRKVLIKKVIVSFAFVISFMAYSKAYAPTNKTLEDRLFSVVVSVTHPSSQAAAAASFSLLPLHPAQQPQTRRGITLEAEGSPLLSLQNKRKKQAFRLLVDLPSPLAALLFDHKLLVSPYQRFLRQNFIDRYANPPFYAVSYNGIPLGVFIFETVHTLPFAALPRHTVRCIRAIAQAEGSHLIEEITESAFKMAPKRDAFFKDPRLTLPPEMRRKYPNGWTSLLSPANQKRLHAVLPALPATVNINDINPKFVLRAMESAVVRALADFLIAGPASLDSIISEIFTAHRRRRSPLEDEEWRTLADADALLDEMGRNEPVVYDNIDLTFNHQLDLIENTEQHLARQHLTSAAPLYYPTLADLDFSDQGSMNYLQGLYTASPEDISMRVRNDHWWKNMIRPLLRKRTSASPNVEFAPCLLMYGQDHNQGSISILNKIVKLPGFRLSLLTRQGWQTWSPEMQIIVPFRSLTDSQGRVPGMPNYGNSRPDSALPDAQGRNPGHRHHGHPWPSSQLDDEHGRWPGSRNYGNPKPDSELPDAYRREPGTQNYGNLLPDNLIPDTHGRYPGMPNYGSP